MCQHILPESIGFQITFSTKSIIQEMFIKNIYIGISQEINKKDLDPLFQKLNFIYTKFILKYFHLSINIQVSK